MKSNFNAGYVEKIKWNIQCVCTKHCKQWNIQHSGHSLPCVLGGDRLSYFSRSL